MTKKLEEWIIENATVVLFGIIALGIALRLFHINYQSLWLDELFSIVPTDPKNSISYIVDYARKDQPPLFFIYIHYTFKLFGYNELVGRLASVVIGIAGVFFVYLLGREIHGKMVGLTAAFVTSINFFHIYYSQELRFYSMAFLFSALSYLFFIKAFKQGKISNFAGYIVFTICLLYTHYYGMVIFATQSITFLVLVFFKRNTKFIAYSTISGILVLAAFIPWIPTVLTDSKIGSGWIKAPSPFFVIEYLYDYTGKDAIAMSLIVLFILSYVIWLRADQILSKEEKLIQAIIILWAILSYLLPYIRSITSAPMLHPRYTIVTLPALILLLTLGWNGIKNIKWKYTTIGLLVMGFSINMSFFKQHYSRIEKEQFREASNYVISNNLSHYPIYSSYSWQYNFYFRNNNDKVYGLKYLDQATIGNFWLLQAHLTPEEQEAEISSLQAHYNIIENKSFNKANAILLQQK